MLAIRAVEVLRSTFLKKDMEARERQGLPMAQPLPHPTTATFPRSGLQKKAPGHVEHSGAGAGVAALTSLDGVRAAFLMDGSLGARLRVTERYSLTLAAHVQVAEPYVARILELARRPSGSVGGPLQLGRDTHENRESDQLRCCLRTTRHMRFRGKRSFPVKRTTVA